MAKPRKEREEVCRGTAFVRLKGKQRHVTVYPAINGRRGGVEKQMTTPAADFTLPEADVLLKTMDWERRAEWTALEPRVFVARVEKL